jgi:hypothetical protein
MRGVCASDNRRVSEFPPATRIGGDVSSGRLLNATVVARRFKDDTAAIHG